MVTRYRSGWDYESLNEFTTVYVARWRGKDGKRYASPFKTKDSAENRAKELRSQGNKEVSVTQDTLRGNIKFKSDNSPDIKGMQKEDVSKDGAYAIGMAKAKDMYNDEKPVDKKTITKAHDIAKAILRKEELDESAAAREIARTNTKKDSMDYGMYNKSVDLLKSKKYDELKKFLKKSDTAPREYVMSTIAKKEPATFKKMYGNQTGYYSLMNQNEEVIVEFTSQQIKQAYGIANDPRYKQGNYDGAVKAIEKIAKGLSKHPDVANVLKRTNEDINERYSVKFSYSKGGKIANAYYDDKDEAEKFIKSVIAKGGKAIMTMEDVGDYLKSKLNSTQIQNIKKTWQNKKASDVTPAVKAHIKNMDIPTQLAIKQANIPHISKLVEQSCECKCGQSPCKSCGKDHHNVKEDASKMAQAMATGTQKKIADLSARIKDTEARRKDIDVGDKTQMAINKADVHHMQLKLADLKDKLRLDRAKRALAAQKEPIKEASNTTYKLVDKKTGKCVFRGKYNQVVKKDKETGYKHKVVQESTDNHPAKSLIENILKKRSKK